MKVHNHFMARERQAAKQERIENIVSIVGAIIIGSILAWII